MSKKTNLMKIAGAAAIASIALASPAFAQEEPFTLSAPETAYVFNTLSFLMTGFLVMFMAAGFAMLEAGLVRSKNVAMQCTKNIALYAVAGILYYLVGYNLMYSGVDGGYFGTISIWGVSDSVPTDGSGYASASDWYFQMVFVATAASIVSGTLAERIRLWPFMIFTVFLTGFIYPIQGAWQWGGGWLSEMGFSDFAGSTIVHSCGGWAALMGALVLGARIGKYGPNGEVNALPGSSMPLATLGTFILWLGWFGFNGGSQLALGSYDNANAVATIFINTNMAAAAGVVVAMVLTQLIYKKVDITMALNGALAGLVSITAEPLTPTLGWAIVIGGIGAVIVVLAVPLLDKLKIDDVVGAIPVHLFCGIWGTMAVPITNADTSFATQATGVISIGIFVSLVSLVLWLALRFTIGIRCSEEEEMMGLDKAEIGVEAYPEFSQA